MIVRWMKHSSPPGGSPRHIASLRSGDQAAREAGRSAPGKTLIDRGDIDEIGLAYNIR